MPERQLCLFEGGRPSWRSLEAATHEELLRLVGELLIEAVQKHCEEEANDERQDHA